MNTYEPARCTDPPRSWDTKYPTPAEYFQQLEDARNQPAQNYTSAGTTEPEYELTREGKIFYGCFFAAWIGFIALCFICDKAPPLWRKWQYWRIEQNCRREAEQRRRKEQKDMARRERELKRQSQVEAAQRSVAATEAFTELKSRLKQLRDDPDFRRCAESAKECRDCAAIDLRHLFGIFREEMLDQVVVRLSSDADKHELLASVRDLVTALRLPAFEADYIFEAARQKLAPHLIRRRSSDFSEQVLQESSTHAERVSAIQALGDTAETIEQLLELEQRRHTQALMRFAAKQDALNEDVITL